MNRQPPDDTSFHSLSPSWSSTTPSMFMDEPTPRHPDAHPKRKPQAPALTAQAHVWLERLPPRYQPIATAQRHPHIINRLSLLWDRPVELPEHFRELMLSSRPGREGFNFEVLTELADLQSMMELMLQKNGRR